MAYPNHIALCIAGGDSLVGHALEQLLQNAGYDARFFDDSVINSPSDSFEKASLVLLGPRTNGAKRKALIGRLRNGMPDTATAVPVLELVGNGEAKDEADARGGVVGVRRVLWPCQLKDLKREIEAALHHCRATSSINEWALER